MPYLQFEHTHIDLLVKEKKTFEELLAYMDMLAQIKVAVSNGCTI